jgi:hypothetical protein
MFNNKKIIIAGIVIFAMSVFVQAFQNETRAQEDALVAVDTTATEGGNNQKGRDILALLADLENIRLDESIFSDPVFQSLQDISRELSPEPKGRPNPFAPLGKDVVLDENFFNSATGSLRSIPFNNEDTSIPSKSDNAVKK